MYRRTVQTTLRSSYIGHYRRGLVALLEVLEFRSNNTAHRPVIDARAMIARYAKAGNLTYYLIGETVPTHRGTSGDLVGSGLPGRHPRPRARDADGLRGRHLMALREQLRCKEIWVIGADSWRNPDEDLPADFEQRRSENYGELRKPLDPAMFIHDLRNEMTAAPTSGP